MLADKEKERKVTQEDLEAHNDEDRRMTKELQNRDGPFSDVEYRRIEAELRDSEEALMTMKNELEDQRRVADLASKVKIPSGAPRIRDWYVERRAEVAQACYHLNIPSCSDPSDGNSVESLRIVGLSGPGGTGKSTVASIVIAREDVRASFHKGVLWLQAGQGAKDRLGSLMLDLAGMVHDTVLSRSCRPPRKAGEQIEDGLAYILEMMTEGRERLLVVLDDVWEVEVLQEVNRVGTWILYTTRKDNLLPGAPFVQVHKIAKQEAEMVLKRAADLDENAVLPGAAYELMRRCEFAVLDIAFVGRWGVVRKRRNQKAWQKALDRILEAHGVGEGVVPLSWRAAVLRAGLEELASDNPLIKELYLALAVLPKGFTFSSEAAAALLYDDVLSAEDAEDAEDLVVAEETAATLERWSILTREDGGDYRVHDDHTAFIQGCFSANKDMRDRMLPRWRKYISSVRALLTYPACDLVEIWEKLASDEGEVVDPSPYDRQLESMDISSAEFPQALKAAAMFHVSRKDNEGAYTKFCKLRELQETTSVSGANFDDVMDTLLHAYSCARALGRLQEATEIQRRADAILEGIGRKPVNFDYVLDGALSMFVCPFSIILCCIDIGCCSADDVDNDSGDGRKPIKWCVDDSAAERVFVPDASRNKYVVVGLGGATVRMSARLDSPVLRTLPQGTVVVVAEVRSRRAHIVKPMDGWASLSTENGYRILESVGRPVKYKVVYEEGILVRSTSSIDEGRIVRIAPFGTVLKATGKTDIVHAVERVEVEDGWVSTRLRNDTGPGDLLIMPLD
eukprot:g14316.t1